MKTNILIPFLTVLLVAGSAGSAYASCVEYMKEAEAVEGVVPKFDQNGKIRAFVIHGEATFIVAKRSLIGKARRKAVLRAKRAFAEFMKQNLNSKSVVEEMTQQVEKTDQAGNTEGMVEELSSQIDIMRSNTSAVLSGLIKLDECVDKNEKFVLVTMGWKPSLSKAAADATTTINKEGRRGNRRVRADARSPRRGTTTRGMSGQTEKRGRPARNSRRLAKVSNRRARATGASTDSNRGSGLPGVRIVVVKVEGIGTNLKRATNEALRSAIAQVFGEQFAAQTKTVDLTDTAEVSGNGMTAGVAVERSSTSESISSKTKGLIKSYSYLEKQTHAEGMRVFLEVKLPKYESGLDPNKSRMIVLRPKLSPSIRTSGGDMDVFSAALQDTLESTINKSRKLTVLDRRFVKAQITELNTIASGNSPVSELARLGNRAGADLLMVSEVISYDQTQEKIQLGNQIIERTIFNAEIAIKVIDVATSNILYSQRFPFRKQRIKASNPASKFGSRIGSRLARRIAGKIGGGVQSGSTGFAGNSNMDVSVKRVKKIFDEAKKESKDEW